MHHVTYLFRFACYHLRPRYYKHYRRKMVVNYSNALINALILTTMPSMPKLTIHHMYITSSPTFGGAVRDSSVRAATPQIWKPPTPWDQTAPHVASPTNTPSQYPVLQFNNPPAVHPNPTTCHVRPYTQLTPPAHGSQACLPR